VQILVVVAIIQMKTLKAEVEMDSAALAISCGLLGPKVNVNSTHKHKVLDRKGMRLIFLKSISNYW